MDFTSVGKLSYSQAQTDSASSAANSITSAAGRLSSQSTEEELKGVLKDFESYFVEQVLKEMKDSFTLKDDEDSDSTMSQYKDMFLDKTIEMMADEIVDSMGENVTQQLYEQMKRNYNIPSNE